MKNTLVAITALFSLGWTAPFATMAQTNDHEALNKLYGDFAPSDLTAATLLGVDASKVSKPSTVKALSASLIQPAMAFPKIGSGLALELAPVLFLPSTRKITKTDDLDKYRRFANALLRSWTLSGATVSESSSTKVAAGAAVTFYDGTDRLRIKRFVVDLVKELDNIKAGQDLSRLTRAASLQADQYATELLRRNGIMQSLPNNTSATDAIYILLHDRINSLGVTPGSNANIPSPAQLEENHGSGLGWLQRSLDSLSSRSSNNGPPLPNLNVGDVMVGARLLAVQGTTAYNSYRALNTNLVTQTTTAVKKANEEFDKETWNATIIQAGFGSTWVSKDQEWSSLSANSTGFFARMALRPGTIEPWDKDGKKSWLGNALAHHVLLVTNVRYNGYRNQPSFAKQKPTTQTDSLRDQVWVGGRLLIGSQYFRISGEFSKRMLWYSEDAKDGATAAKKNLINAWNSYAIGAEVRLNEKLWLEFGVGETYPDGQRKGQVFALSSIKYSIQNTQRFTTQ